MNRQEHEREPDRDEAGGGEDKRPEREEAEPEKQSAPPAQDQEPPPEAWEAVEQLFALAPHLRAGRANVMGDTRVRGDVVAGDKHVRVHLHSGEPSRLRRVGPLPATELERVERTFAPNRCYDQLCAGLTEERVLVLRGRRGTGRRTAALRMMRQTGKEAVEVIALDPGTEPAEYAGHVLPGKAHLVVDPAAGEDGPLRDIHLHAVRHRLADSGGLFVVVVDHGTVLDGVEVKEWTSPRPADVVTAHLRHLLQQSGHSRAEASAEIDRLLQMEVSERYVRSGPSPQEAAEFARLLTEYSGGRCGLEQLTGYGRMSADALVDSWFGDSGTDLRDKAFLISLAAFDGSPYPLVVDLGDRLYGRLDAVERPEHAAAHPVFGTSRAKRLELARAREYSVDSDTPWGRIPEQAVEFENENIWSAVLRHVWNGHPAVREPLLEWLDALVADQRPLVRLRGAVSAGVLASSDFGYACERFLTRWASSPSLMERQLAAWALYTAAEHGMDTPVGRLLGVWSRQSDLGQRWTAARTYALLGGTTVTTALRDIGRMAAVGPVPDAALQAALEQTLDVLLQGPAATTVLGRLVQWRGSGDRLGELAARGFLGGAARRRYEPGAGSAWPRLLWLADRDPVARRHVVVLWRGLLGDRSTRDEARDGVARWVRAADHASAKEAAARSVSGAKPAVGVPPDVEAVSDVEEALRRLLPELAVTANERDRLDYLLRRLRDGSGKPGPAAQRLRTALPGGPPQVLTGP
ncbi:hypothetical protein [Streptomyces pinistramenti]|uniref:hypothetical protein n=1 Tax=Streptomyces pinistramenti TaxID=2884812 RepID=UPI001D097232|nr:hypothetical protein [Streptomyces pinistramenti]MCB5911597.1 hypothetical protein [Streptomyces pinistramenti]